MSKLCHQCSNLLYDGEKICMRCGAVQKVNAARLPDEPLPAQLPPYQKNEISYNSMDVYEEPLTTAQWLWTVVATNLFSVVSLVITIVWACRRSTHGDKKILPRPADLSGYLVGDYSDFCGNCHGAGAGFFPLFRLTFHNIFIICNKKIVYTPPKM